MAGNLRRLVMRLRLAGGSRRAERELAREMAAHLGVLEDDFRRRGMSDQEARFAARRAIGGVEQAKELHRDARSIAWIATARRDVRFACRTLVRSRGVTALAILTLGLGIGAATAVYSALDAALLRPLPFPEPERLVRIRGFGVPLDLWNSTNDSGHTGARPKTALDVLDLAAMREVFSHVAAHATGATNLGSGVEPLRVDVTFVTADFFTTLGRGPQLGRVFGPADMAAGGPSVVILSDRLWRSHFGGDPSIVGRTVRIDTVPHDVIGIMPPDFRFPALAQMWKPLPVPAPMAIMSAFRNFLPAALVARLAPGVTDAAAAARIETAQARFERPGAAGMPPATQPLVTPLQQALIGDRRTSLLVLMGSAGLLLVIACANAATLLLSRAAARRRELATHAVLGASRQRIVVRLLIESGLVAGGGALVGIAAAAASVSILGSLVPPGLAGLAPVQVDLRVLAFTVAVSMLTGIGFGLWPAVGGSRVALDEALQKSGDRTVTGTGSRGLVVAQVALACVLTIGAGLMLTSLRSLLAIDLGMRVEDVAAARINLPPAAYDGALALGRFVQSAVGEIRRSPLVADAAAINALPLAGEAGVMLRLDEQGATDRERSEPRHSAPYLVVSPGYFRTMGIPLLAGRDLEWTDGATNPVAVINRTMARRFWPDVDPLGKRFLFTDLRTVVGVVDDAQITRLGGEIGPQVYLPIQEQPQNYVSLVARRARAADLGAVIAHIRAGVRRVDPELPLYAVQPMEDVLAEALAPRRTNTLLIALFGGAALGLSAIGVYGVLACSVAQRTREIGVRVALGAERRQVMRLILRQGTRLMVPGIGIGVATALLATKYLEGMLYGVAPRDPAVFAAVVLVLVMVGLVASLVPARRAASADPLVALRSD